jgi:hypothetical protein
MNHSLPEEKPGAASGPIARIGSPTGFAIGALCASILAFYHGLWLPGLVLIKRDAFRFFLPLKQYLIERLTAGELPQWFPYEGLGRSFIGVTHTGIFHPFTLLYFLLPISDAYRASTLLSCLLAALGAYALGRLLTLSRLGAFVAGLGFALSGYVVSMTENLVYLYSICVLPLFCATLEQALKKSGAWMTVPAVLWASVFLNGDVQTGYYYAFIALLWMTARTPGSYRKGSLTLAAIGGLAALLAGIQLAPAWTVFAGSERAQASLFHAQTLDWSTHPLRLLTALVSPVGGEGDPVPIARVFFGIPKGGFWSESLYWGIPLTGLACIGAWFRRDLKVFVALGSLALLLSLGRYGGLYELFSQVIPLWSAFRYPEKFMGVASFAIAMLAGAGIDTLREGKSGPLPWALAAGLCAGAGLVLHSTAASAWAAATFGASAWLATEMTASAASAALWSAAVACGVSLIVLSLRKSLLREAVLLGALAAILALDLARANFPAYHTGPVEAASFVPTLAEAVKAREGRLAPGRFRMVSIYEDILVWPQELMASLGFYGATSVERRQALDSEHNAQFGLETVLPYLSGYSSQFAQTLNPRTGMEVAARFNATYFVGRRHHLKDPRLAKDLLAESPAYDLALFRNPVLAKPRAYLSMRPETAVRPIDPAGLFARPDFLSGEVDVLETAGETLPESSQDGSTSIDHYTFEEVRVRVETPKPAVLVLLDSFEKGWRAVLETGAEVPILRANALVRAVVVPAGSHVVTFRYETPLLRAGAAASFAGALLCLGLIVHAQRRTRRTGPTT